MLRRSTSILHELVRESYKTHRQSRHTKYIYRPLYASPLASKTEHNTSAIIGATVIILTILASLFITLSPCLLSLKQMSAIESTYSTVILLYTFFASFYQTKKTILLIVEPVQYHCFRLALELFVSFKTRQQFLHFLQIILCQNIFATLAIAVNNRDFISHRHAQKVFD